MTVEQLREVERLVGSSSREVAIMLVRARENYGALLTERLEVSARLRDLVAAAEALLAHAGKTAISNRGDFCGGYRTDGLGPLLNALRDASAIGGAP